MDIAELKQALVTRGQVTSGARQTLINRYLSSDPRTYSDEQLFRYIHEHAADHKQNTNIWENLLLLLKSQKYQ